MKWFEDHPTFSIGGAIVLVLLIGAYLLQKKSGTATTATASDLTGLGVNAAGQPVVYVPTSTQFYTDNSQTATSAQGAPATINNSTTSTATTTSTSSTVTTNPIAPLPHPTHGGEPTGGTHPPRHDPPPPPKGKSINWHLGHHVGAGETLGSIADQATGMVRRSGGPANFRVTGQQIYQHNAATIEAKVRAMKGHSQQLYPGELIVVPEWS